MVHILGIRLQKTDAIYILTDIETNDCG